MKVAKLTWAFAAAMLLSSSVAEAGIVFSKLNLIQFSNRELEIDGGGTAGVAQIGDRLVGVLNTNQINAEGVFQTPPTPELTGVFDLTIELMFKGDNTVLTNADIAGGYTGTAFLLFRPTNVTGAEGALGGLGAGTALALFEGGPADLLATLNDAGKTTADAFTAASDGTLVGSFGFGDVAGSGAGAFDTAADWGAAGNGYWYATTEYAGGVSSALTDFYYGLQALAGPILTAGPLAPLANPNLPVGTSIPTATSIAANKPFPFATTFFDLTGKGTTQLNDSNAGTSPADQAKFPIFSNDPARVHPSPEPSSMVLFALGALCGIPYLRRRRKNRVA